MKTNDFVPRITVPPRKSDGLTGAAPGNGAGDRATLRLPSDDPSRRSPDDSPEAPSHFKSLSSQYAIIEKIGEGGMGVVYLARDRTLGRFAAIKRLHRTALASGTMKDRFFLEAKAVAALNHIHIVHVYFFGEDEDGPYIVMEYIPGPPDASPGKTPPSPFSLADRVHRNGPLSIDLALSLLLKVCRAIEYAHSAGVIHRDIKPSNVLLDESGEPKLVDFGLARNVDADEHRITAPGEKMLSLGYGAPEQEADASLADERADVYGLGALLYFSVTGKNPRYFREADLPEALRMPLVKALDTDRAKRWVSAKEFGAALTLITAPSTIELPTARATWRCKWCDTVNPVATRYCGACGWDGGESCAECGAEMRVGIQFCGACGADARTYETTRLLLDRLHLYREQKSFEQIVQQAGAVSGFLPVGARGRELVDEIRRAAEEAAQSIERREKLRQLIHEELSQESHELVQRTIDDYKTLSSDNAFAEIEKDLPQRIAKRNMKRGCEAAARGDWPYAARMYQAAFASVPPGNPDIRSLLESLQRRRSRVRLRNSLLGVATFVLVYLFSAAPMYRLAGTRWETAFHRVYVPFLRISRLPLVKPVFEKYDAWWNARDLHKLTIRAAPETPMPMSDKANEAFLSEPRADYEKNLRDIESDYAHRVDIWPREYRRALAELQKSMQQTGDFEGWAAARDEMRRFDENSAIDDNHIVEAPDDLRNLQIRFKMVPAQYSIERSLKILALANAHVDKLTALQKDLTINGKMDEASVINAEIKQVKNSKAVVDAEQEVARQEPPSFFHKRSSSSIIPTRRLSTPSSTPTQPPSDPAS